MLVREPRTAAGLIRGDAAGQVPDAMRRMALPPFAQALATAQGWRVTQDGLGFRSLFQREEAGWAAISTSARALEVIEPAGINEPSFAVLSLAGWPVSDDTPWRRVRMLRHGGLLADGQVMPFSADALSEPVAGDAVAVAARILRKTISVLLDEHPDALLQLTGGIDSRLLLAAIEPRRRSSVSVLTLRTAGSQDAAIAGSLAARWGMKHVLRDFAAVEALSPEEAFAACLEVTDRLDGAADPIAATAVEIAEHGRSPQARIVGLGGEVARGFYYVGPLWADRVSTGRIHRFADWRVFANEAAPTEMLTREFSSWAVGEARRRVRDSFLEQPGGWFDRTDAFYLHQRMRRWAGGLASAWCMERADVNPMLDPRFVALVTGLRPSDKADLQFLARLLDHLDPELAALAMDGRPPPQAYLNTTPGARVALAAIRSRKLVGKVGQRLTGRRRAPEAGEVLAAKVASHLSSRADLLEQVVATGIVDPSWLDQLHAGVGVSPGGVGFLLRVLSAVRV